MIKKEKIEYYDGAVLLEGYCVYNEKDHAKRPLVLVAHDWTGRNEFACQKADKLAELGYVGFALDVYGKGKLGKDKEEKSTLAKPFFEDRNLLRRRMLIGLEVAKKTAVVNHKYIGAIGFCFGGMCVLDLARSGVGITGVVSFHGLLNAPENAKKNKIHAKVLALHGHDDPMVPPDQVLAFQKEMTAAGADWQMNIYGNTMHGFTNPLANDPGFGTVYNAHSDKRAWLAMKDFFSEIFF